VRDVTNVYDLTMPSITGEQVALGDYRGKVLLVVNVASR
jgi:glutathione peroxidase-family protein